MIVTLAGRRIDAPDAIVARFPLEKSGTVYKQIQQFLMEKHATVLVSSAACGADLLALDAAGKLGIRRRVILSSEPERFRAGSVTDRPGDWGTLYDRIIAEIEAAGDLVLLQEQQSDEATYLRTNQVILDEAEKLAEEVEETRSGENTLLAVLVWEGQARKTDDITAAFGREARARAIPTTEILIS